MVVVTDQMVGNLDIALLLILETMILSNVIHKIYKILSILPGNVWLCFETSNKGWKSISRK